MNDMELEVHRNAQSRAMFVARLENMQRNGDAWLTIQAVLMLMNDCDMLAARANPSPAETALRRIGECA